MVQVHSGAPNGALVQLGERYPCKVEVVGSTPTRSTIIILKWHYLYNTTDITYNAWLGEKA